jgi:hypothetical protein
MNEPRSNGSLGDASRDRRLDTIVESNDLPTAAMVETTRGPIEWARQESNGFAANR